MIQYEAVEQMSWLKVASKPRPDEELRLPSRPKPGSEIECDLAVVQMEPPDGSKRQTDPNVLEEAGSFAGLDAHQERRKGAS